MDLPRRLTVRQAAKVLCMSTTTIESHFTIQQEGEADRRQYEKFATKVGPKKYVQVAEILAAAQFRDTTLEKFKTALAAALHDQPSYVSTVVMERIFGYLNEKSLPRVKVYRKVYYLYEDIVALLAPIAEAEGVTPEQLFWQLSTNKRQFTTPTEAARRFRVLIHQTGNAATERGIPFLAIPRSDGGGTARLFLFPR